MTEDFLYYIWKYKLLTFNDLKTCEGENIEIIKPGIHNTDAGPDFFNARIRINNTEWAGNIEIHVKSSDWFKHKHNQNQQYDSVILHVVFEYDAPVYRQNNTLIPSLSLKNRFDQNLFLRYKTLLENKYKILCEKSVSSVNQSIVNIWKEKLLIERLLKKSQQVEERLIANKHDWNQTFFEYLCKNFGFKTNATAFEMLSRSLPLSSLGKHHDSLFQIESLLFGQAGFLNQIFIDEYPQQLQKEYYFLKKKFNLKPLNHALWNLLRLRPGNFPHIRIAQLAALLNKSSVLFSKITEYNNIASLKNLFSYECSSYWKTHYLFDKQVAEKSTKIGNASVDNIVINTIVPFLFAYGTIKSDIQYKERALDFLEQIEPETNHIITLWKDRGMLPKSAWDTQALIELKNAYCTPKKCLSCMIGDAVLKEK